MHIIKEQLKRIKHFLAILMVLFLVNAGFNLKYDWGGVSVIARVYLLVLSFYIIFIFSQLDIDEYRTAYRNNFGRVGKYYLFFATRIFPFLFIYLLTMLFTLINYLNADNWPIEPILRLFNGRYSNTIIYSLILFMVLKQKKRPGISIPLFIIGSVCYFGFDKIVYYLFNPGKGVSIIKITKYIIFIFILIYDFSKSRWRLLESAFFSIVTGLLIYISVLGIFLSVFFMSSYESPAFSISGDILLRSGFTFPLEKLQKKIINEGSFYEIRNVFSYIEKYNIDAGYEITDWEKIIRRNRIEKNELIFRYLNRKNIKLDFNMLRTYAEEQLQVPMQEKSDIENFARHFSVYYTAVKPEFFSMYESGNEQIKILVLKSLAYTSETDAVIFLIDKLTNVNSAIAETAYNSLQRLTKKDPASDLKKEIYDLDVILYFRHYLTGLKK